MVEEITINKIIALVLVVLVIAVVGLAIFKPGILEWIKNLPEYKYDVDEEIDISELEDVELTCPGDIPKIVGRIQKEGEVVKVLYYGTIKDKTGFINYGFEMRGKEIIWKGVYVGYELLKIADVENNIIKVNKELFDLNSETWKEIGNYISEDWAGFFVELEGAKISENFLICRTKEKAQIEIKRIWEKNQLEVWDWGHLKPEIVTEVHPSLIPDSKRYKIELNFPLNKEKIDYLYITKGDDKLYINGAISWSSNEENLGIIYPSGAVWLNIGAFLRNNYVKKGSDLPLYKEERVYVMTYFETNIRIPIEDYVKLKNWLEEK